MTTTSKPVIYDEAAIAASTITADDTNVNGADWATMGLRDIGVDSGMVLTLSTVSDVGTISTGVGVWRGFILRVTASHTVNIPAVTSAKTYSVGVLFDPANFSTPDGPLSLAVFDKAAISIPSGGAFFTLWEVDRLPSTTLNASTVRTYRHIRGGFIYANSLLPQPSEVTAGTFAGNSKGLYVRDSVGSTAAWLPITNDTGEITSGVIMSSGWSNAGTSYQTLNGITSVHIKATRTGSTITSTSTGSVSDVEVLTLPAAARSRWLEPVRGTATLAVGGTTGLDCRLYTSGLVTITSANPNTSIAAGSVLLATATFIH